MLPPPFGMHETQSATYVSLSLSLLAWQEVSWHRKSGSTGVCQFYGMCYKQLVEVLLTASAAVSQQFPAKNLN